MAKDDYHVIIYQILAYLYKCLKEGKEVEGKNIANNSKLFQINENYWKYIIYHLQESGLIEGIVFADIDGMEYPHPTHLDNCRITPKGIEYLCDNSLMQKVKKLVIGVADIAPLIF